MDVERRQSTAFEQRILKSGDLLLVYRLLHPRIERRETLGGEVGLIGHHIRSGRPGG